MSYYDDASLVLIPSGVKASKVYSQKPTDGTGDLTFTRASTATRTNESGVIESVASNVPRLDYSGGATCPSLLLEPQRTNLVLRSEEFDNAAWTKTALTATANTTISPDGTTDADTLTGDGTVSAKFTFTSSSITSGSVYSFSCFIKKGTNNFAQITAGSTGFGLNVFANFNLDTGTVGSVGTSSTASIQNVGNGWYRCIVTGTSIFTGSTPAFVLALVDSSTALRAAPNTLSTTIFVWGAQLELGAYATTYIPTTTAAVTRIADAASKTGISSLIGQTEGTLFAEINVTKLVGSVSRYIFHISDGTADNRIYFAFSGSSTNVLRGRIFSGGVLQCSIDTATITATGTYKLALAYKLNDIAFYVNGVQVGTDTSATIPTCSRVDVGSNYASASQFSDGIAQAALFPTRLTNAQLAELTTL